MMTGLVNCEEDAGERANKLVAATSPSRVPELLDLKSKAEKTIRYVDLGQADQQTNDTLSLYGISPRMCSRIWEQSVRALVSPDIEQTDEEVEIFRAFNVSKEGYVDDLLSRGAFVILDIFTGLENLSTHAFLLDQFHIAYRFSSKEIYYVLTRRWRGHVALIMIPRLHIVIGFPSVDGGNPSDWNIALLDDFYAKVAGNYDDMSRRLNNSTHAICLTLGHHTNLGHFFWTDLGGIADVLERYGSERIQRIITGPHMYVGLEDVFPELLNIPMVRSVPPDKLFEVGLQYNEQYVSPIGTRITSKLRQRVSAACSKMVGRGTLDEIRAAVEGRFVFWINLRSHNKAWVRQNEGFVYILRELAAVVKNEILVVLDGYEDTCDVADKLAGDISHICKVKSTLGSSFAESLVWAEHSHIFCSVVGSGLVINTWLAGKPGVAHANGPHMPQAKPWKYVADNISDVEFVYPIRDIDPSLYSNYDVDEVTIANKLLQLTKKYYPDILLSAN